ncbi:hypothetical protein FOL47_009463 [Perkinsus chesapeaki]|uniref:Uncharacterized protein n=1 Tax=Perkinsus chesapeaki TaxID=330153 RepID=A0A7J6L847_PERCH|nr:hypothetical protein FOL47_009463 [Perkinsus chesapeaki]
MSRRTQLEISTLTQENFALRLELALVRSHLRDQDLRLTEALQRLSALDIDREHQRIDICIDDTGTAHGAPGTKGEEEDTSDTGNLTDLEIPAGQLKNVEKDEARERVTVSINEPEPRVRLHHQRLHRLSRLIRETMAVRELNEQAARASALAAEHERQEWLDGLANNDEPLHRDLIRSGHLAAYGRHQARSELRTKYVQELNRRQRRLIGKLEILLKQVGLIDIVMSLNLPS